MTNEEKLDAVRAYQANRSVPPLVCPHRDGGDHPVRPLDSDRSILVPMIADDTVVLGCQYCPYHRYLSEKEIQRLAKLATFDPYAMVRSDPELASICVQIPQTIPSDHWLHEQRFAWMKKGLDYAATQTYAIPALSKCSPGEAAHLVWAVMRGAGLRIPDEPAGPEFAERLGKILGPHATSPLMDAIIESMTLPPPDAV